MAETLRPVSDRHRPSPKTIISGQGGLLEISSRLQRFLVIFADGRVLAAPAALGDPELLTICRRAAALGISLGNPQEASLDEISAANAHVEDVVKYATQARQTLFSILNHAAQCQASDILLGRNESVAQVRLRINGVMRDHRTLDPERATAIANAAINACNSGDSLASVTRAARGKIQDIWHLRQIS